jgi:CBS-domain-containing membrane protein
MDELLRVPVQDLVSRRELITVDKAENLRSALWILGDSGILSAPVVDQDKAVYGFLDYLMVANFLIEECGGNISKLDNSILETKIENLFQKSHTNMYMNILSNNPATLAVEFFGSGIHRCSVYDLDGRVSSVLSQSDIIRFVRKQLHQTHLQGFFQSTVSTVGWGKHRVVSVHEKDTVFDTLQVLCKQRLSGVAIVNESSELVANFSMSDLRNCTYDILTFMTMSVMEFLAHRSPLSLEPVVITPDATVNEVLKTLADSKLHRMWIVDKGNHPQGVVTLTDVMNTLMRFSPQLPSFALKIPGKLTVTIAGARNLKTGWLSKPYVVVHVAGRTREVFITPAMDDSKSPEWENQSFTLDIDSHNARDNLLFLVKSQKFFGSDDDIGYFVVPIDWVLSGFGAGPALTFIEDDFSLKTRDPDETDQGELRLRMVYSPNE